MKIQWATMAEGITVDARGALAAVGLTQSVLVAPILPVGTKRAVVLLLTGANSEFVPGQPVKFSFQIAAPSGEVLFEHKASIPMASNNFPEVPTGITISAEASFTIKEYGQHLVNMTVQPSGHPEMNTELEFYVMKPLDNSISAVRDPGSTSVT
jgi:hypothetical protein